MKLSKEQFQQIIQEEASKVLAEGKFEQETTNLVRDVFVVLRSFVENPNSPLNTNQFDIDNQHDEADLIGYKRAKKVFENKKRYGIDEATLIVTKYHMNEGPPVDVGGRFDVERYRETGTTSIIIEVDITSQFSEEDYNEAHLELKELIRHEIEHSAQEWSPEDDPIDVWSYFKSKNEVEAYTAGLYKRAKIEKKPFEQVLDEFIEKIKTILVNRYRTPQSQSGTVETSSDNERVDAGLAIVRQKMMEFAKKRFPAAQFK